MAPHKDNPHSIAFDVWRRKMAARVLGVRGGAVRLAEHLGVTRQSVHRWLRGPTPMPAWAAIACNVWWHKHRDEYPDVLFSEPVRLGRDKSRALTAAAAGVHLGIRDATTLPHG